MQLALIDWFGKFAKKTQSYDGFCLRTINQSVHSPPVHANGTANTSWVNAWLIRWLTELSFWTLWLSIDCLIWWRKVTHLMYFRKARIESRNFFFLKKQAETGRPSVPGWVNDRPVSHWRFLIEESSCTSRAFHHFPTQKYASESQLFTQLIFPPQCSLFISMPEFPEKLLRLLLGLNSPDFVIKRNKWWWQADHTRV